jgi:hypothetical protein
MPIHGWSASISSASICANSADRALAVRDLNELAASCLDLQAGHVVSDRVVEPMSNGNPSVRATVDG